MKCKFCGQEFEEKDFLFCPYCAKPLTKKEIKEWERPTSRDLKFIITDPTGFMINGCVLANKKCIEIHLMGRKKATVIQIDLKTLDVDIFQDNLEKTEVVIRDANRNK